MLKYYPGGESTGFLYAEYRKGDYILDFIPINIDLKDTKIHFNDVCHYQYIF